jgi:hypothetical protein
MNTVVVVIGILCALNGHLFIGLTIIMLATMFN